MPARPALVLLAGPSGSGKSRLAQLSGCVSVRLDDFYRDADDDDMPCWGDIVDWDDPHSWNGAAAIAAMTTLLEQGSVSVPVYDISLSRRIGYHELTLPDAPPGQRVCIVAEGIFAPELVRCLALPGRPARLLAPPRPRPAGAPEGATHPAPTRLGPVAQGTCPTPRRRGEGLRGADDAAGRRPHRVAS